MHFFVRFFCMSSGFEIRSVCRMEQQTGFFFITLSTCTNRMLLDASSPPAFFFSTFLAFTELSTSAKKGPSSSVYGLWCFRILALVERANFSLFGLGLGENKFFVMVQSGSDGLGCQS